MAWGLIGFLCAFLALLAGAAWLLWTAMHWVQHPFCADLVNYGGAAAVYYWHRHES